MDTGNTFIYQNILTDMSEGILVVNLNGKISMLNPAASELLGVPQEMVGESLVSAFFDSVNENDEFTQMILNAVYEKDVKHNVVIDYNLPGETRQYFVSTSFVSDGEHRIGIVAVIKDITEMMELRDAVRAMEQIRQLNFQLEKRNEFIKKIFGRYLSDDIVEEILEKEDGLKLGGQKKKVTIMFTDLRGFTNISEQMEPTDLLAMLNHYLERMIQIITEHHGTILEFLGDAIVVVFGAPKAREEMEREAVLCALCMQNDMKQVNEWNASQGYPFLQMGIGIHTGEAILGNVGSRQKTKYDMIGNSVNLASRIETFTIGGQILISEDTRQAIKDPLQIRETVPIELKGVKEKVQLYDVYGMGEIMLERKEEIFHSVEDETLYIQNIEGKVVSEEIVAVPVCAVSENEIILELGKQVQNGSSVIVRQTPEEEEKRIAKVIESKEGKVKLRFTVGSLKD